MRVTTLKQTDTIKGQADDRELLAICAVLRHLESPRQGQNHMVIHINVVVGTCPKGTVL